MNSKSDWFSVSNRHLSICSGQKKSWNTSGKIHEDSHILVLHLPDRSPPQLMGHPFTSVKGMGIGVPPCNEATGAGTNESSDVVFWLILAKPLKHVSQVFISAKILENMEHLWACENILNNCHLLIIHWGVHLPQNWLSNSESWSHSKVQPSIGKSPVARCTCITFITSIFTVHKSLM